VTAVGCGKWLCVGASLVLLVGAHSTAAQSLTDTTSNVPVAFLNEYAKAVNEGWVWFGGGFNQHYWFLPKTIRRTPRGTSTVWTVSIQSLDDTTADWSSARRAIIAQRERTNQPTAGYETYLLTKAQWELDCVHERIRTIQLLEYNEAGEAFHSGKIGGEWEDPVPDTNGENLIRIFCHPSLRKTFRELLNAAPPPGNRTPAGGTRR
jgi:hypothetical protein